MERDYFMGAQEAIDLGLVDTMLIKKPKAVSGNP
jgi:ATP-dependent protease ClpP protease subunit